MPRNADIRRAISLLLTRYCLTETETNQDNGTGDTLIGVGCSRLLFPGSEVQIGDSVTTVREQLTIDAISIDPPLATAAPAGSTVAKLPRFDIVDRLPKVFPRHPLCVVDILTRTQEPIGIQLYSWHYVTSINLYVEAGSETEARDSADKISERIENVLQSLPHPIVSAAGTATLAEPMTDSDTVFRVTDVDGDISPGEIILCDCANERLAVVKASLGNGVYELTCSPGVPFAAGSLIVSPSMSAYNCNVTTTWATDERALVERSSIIYEFDTALVSAFYQWT